MNLIEELEKLYKAKSKNGTIQEKEKIAVEFLNGIDFSDPQIKAQAQQYVQHILTDLVGRNEELSSLEAKIVHCMITKMVLSELGLGDVQVNYRDRTEKDGNAGAYYLDGTINFFNHSVCNREEWLRPARFTDVERAANYRLDYFIRQVFVLEHEIQHVVQFKNMHESAKATDALTPETFIISRQYVARIFAAGAQNSKYWKQGLDAERLYHQNHDQFYYEIDADLQGYKRTLDILRRLSPKAYELAIDEKKNGFLSKMAKKQYEIDNYSTIYWKHDTNPENVNVSANHKASMIIDNILPQLSARDRKEFMDNYPALYITYNSNGTKKSLEQVEREKQEKINNLLINGTDKEIQDQAAVISKVYDTAIESDPILCFEKCLQHIARLTWDSDRYFTNSGIEVKYNPNEVRKELKLAEQKARAIASYMEDTNARAVKDIFEKYKKELMANRKYDQTSLRFFEDKKLAIFNIEGELNHNREVKAVIEKDLKEDAQRRIKKKMQKAKAEEIIKKVFPDFTPSPQKGVIKDGSIEFYNNVFDRMMLMEAYKQYVKTITKENPSARKEKDFIPSGMLYSAIRELYDFTPTEEEQRLFDEALKNGEIQLVRNRYQLQDAKTKGSYSQEEVKRTEGSTFTWTKSAANQPDKHPTDPESDAEKARFESQRQAAAAKHAQQMEEQKGNKQEDEYGVIRQEDARVNEEIKRQRDNQDIEIGR